MFLVAIQAGLRIHEVAGLPLGRLTEIPQGASILVIGKGNRRRKVSPWISGGGAAALRAWLELRGPTSGAVFAKIDSYDHIHISKNGMRTDALRRILHQRAQKVGLPLETEWHDFRRTILSDVIAHAGPTTTQPLAGHSSSATTARYDRLWRVNVQEAIDYWPDDPSPTNVSRIHEIDSAGLNLIAQSYVKSL